MLGILNKFRKPLLVLFIIVISVGATTHSAKAFCLDPTGVICGNGIGGLITGLVEDLFSFVLDIVSFIFESILGIIASIVFKIVTGFVNLALSMNNGLNNPDQILGVKEGFKITYQIANLGIIASAIVAAFMVMFRRGNPKVFLIRLIVVALLLPFTLPTIGTFVLTPVSLISKSFSDAANFGSGSFATVINNKDLTGSFTQLPTFGIINENATSSSLGTLANKFEQSFGIIFFKVAMIIIGSIVLFGFAIMLLIRYVVISFLLIVFPIAAVLWIFPNLKIPGGNPMSLWTEKFMQWLLFAPIALFFFYIAIKLTESIYSGAGISGYGGSPVAQMLGAMFIINGFIVGGLIVAQRMGITGAKATMMGLKKVQAFTKRQAKERSKRGATRIKHRAEQSDTGQAVVRRLQNADNIRIPGINVPLPGTGRVARATGRAAERSADKTQKSINDRQAERIKDMGVETAINEINSGDARGDRLVALLEKVSKDNRLNEVNGAGDILNENEAVFNRLGKQDELEQMRNRTITPETGQTQRQLLQQMPRGDLEKALPAWLAQFNPDHPEHSPHFDATLDLAQNEATHNAARDNLINDLLDIKPDIIAKIKPELDHEALTHLQGEITNYVNLHDAGAIPTPTIDVQRGGNPITINVVDATAKEKTEWLEQNRPQAVARHAAVVYKQQQRLGS